MKFADIKIVAGLNDSTITEVWVDGVKVSDKISAVTFKAAGGEMPVVILEYPVGNLQVVGSIIVRRSWVWALWRRLTRLWERRKPWWKQQS